MNASMIVLMIAAALAMFWGLAKQKAGIAWGRPVATVAAIVAVAAALWQLLGGGTPSGEDVARIERAYQRIGAQKLGIYLAGRFPNARVLIVTEPKSDAAPDVPDSNSSLLQGLREGLEGKVTIVGEVAPEMPEGLSDTFRGETGMPPGEPGMEEMLPPTEFWFTAAVFDKLVEEHKDRCDLVVSTIGLPMDLRGMKFWRMRTAPKLALANASVYELRAAIKSDRVSAAVTYNPTAAFELVMPPSDLDEAFSKRFLLVTAENVDEIAETYAELFPN